MLWRFTKKEIEALIERDCPDEVLKLNKEELSAIDKCHYGNIESNCQKCWWSILEARKVKAK
jgi:hypothetical protein